MPGSCTNLKPYFYWQVPIQSWKWKAMDYTGLFQFVLPEISVIQKLYFSTRKMLKMRNTHVRSTIFILQWENIWTRSQIQSSLCTVVCLCFLLSSYHNHHGVRRACCPLERYKIVHVLHSKSLEEYGLHFRLSFAPLRFPKVKGVSLETGKQEDTFGAVEVLPWSKKSCAFQAC